MSLPNKYHTGKSIPNSVNDYYPAELGTPTSMLSQDWLYTDLENTSINQFPLYAPPLNLVDKSLDVFGGSAGDPFGCGISAPLPTTVSAADLNLRAAPIPPVGNVASQASRTTSSSDDSLLLGSGGADNSEPLTTPDDSELASKPAYKPGWATSGGMRGSECTSSTTSRSKKRVKSGMPPVKPRRMSPRNLSLTSTRTIPDIKEDPDEFSSPETAEPSTSKSKRSHNLTEKKYRTRLNGYFETLLSVIPRSSGNGETASTAADGPEKKISKGEVLVLAMEYIKELEKDQTELERQRASLGSDMDLLKDASSGIDGERVY